jgi:ABC transporter substrate binding protein
MNRTLGALLIIFTLGLLVAPLAAEAQPPTHVHRIGYLLGTTREQEPALEAFLEGMRALGYVEGQHLVLESRLAAGQYERFPALAAELVRLPVDVIVAAGAPAIRAAKQATSTIPIVLAPTFDPVGEGLVTSLSRLGGNVTKELLAGYRSYSPVGPRSSPSRQVGPTRSEGYPSKLKFCMQCSVINRVSCDQVQRRYQTYKRNSC